jgi:hypothetical protein
MKKIGIATIKGDGVKEIYDFIYFSEAKKSWVNG